MKISLALLLLLLAAAWTSSQGMSFLNSRSICCSKFHRQRIPEFKIQGYQETASSCTHKAVLVKLGSRAFVCVDPKEKWFQDYLRKQKKPKSTST